RFATALRVVRPCRILNIMELLLHRFSQRRGSVYHRALDSVFRGHLASPSVLRLGHPAWGSLHVHLDLGGRFGSAGSLSSLLRRCFVSSNSSNCSTSTP